MTSPFDFISGIFGPIGDALSRLTPQTETPAALPPGYTRGSIPYPTAPTAGPAWASTTPAIPTFSGQLYPLGYMPGSTPTEPAQAMPDLPLTPFAAIGSALGRLPSAITNNANTLMALGGGIAKGGIAGGLTAAAEAGLKEAGQARKVDMALFRRLIAARIPPDLALTIAQNPTLAQQAIAQPPKP